MTLIEKKDKLGSDCLHTGRVPSKTLIKVAKVASLMRRGAEFGLNAVNPETNLVKVKAHVQSVISNNMMIRSGSEATAPKYPGQCPLCARFLPS